MRTRRTSGLRSTSRPKRAPIQEEMRVIPVSSYGCSLVKAVNALNACRANNKTIQHMPHTPHTHLTVVEEPSHEVRLRASVVTQPVLAEPSQVVHMHVGRIQRKSTVKRSQRLLAFAPVSEQRAEVGPRFLETSPSVRDTGKPAEGS